MTVPQTTSPDVAPTDVDIDNQGPSADLVRVYLNGIGRTALLTAQDEVSLAKRIEAGVFAKHLLDTSEDTTPERRTDLKAVVRDGRVAKNVLFSEDTGLRYDLLSHWTGDVEVGHVVMVWYTASKWKSGSEDKIGFNIKTVVVLGT